MDALIDDILTLAREGSDVGEMKTVETEEIIKDCWSNVETEDATLVTQLEREVEADPRRLKQLCENLVRNAVEHGSTGNQAGSDDTVGGDENVTVTVGELDYGNGFYVADDGDGIPDEKRDEIFETDYSTSEQGTGFGLRIVEGIVEAHGWDIEVTESQDGGARFEINTGDS
jgi:signal transduction histidine kinase